MQRDIRYVNSRREEQVIPKFQFDRTAPLSQNILEYCNQVNKRMGGIILSTNLVVLDDGQTVIFIDQSVDMAEMNVVSTMIEGVVSIAHKGGINIFPSLDILYDHLADFLNYLDTREEDDD